MKGKKPNHRRGTALAASLESQETQIKGSLWIERQGEIFLSWGRVVLLERIRETGSIAAAARIIEMAYSHAWTLVANMNRLAGEELVGRTFGGRNGGKAWLTPAGEAAITQFSGTNLRFLIPFRHQARAICKSYLQSFWVW